jgi:hypothetical protein
MPSSELLAGTVMDMSAVLLNDRDKTTYTYAIQIPYLQMSLQELEEFFQLNAISTVQITSSPVIQIDAGITEIVFGATAPAPSLPANLVDIQRVWIRNRNSNPFIPMSKVDFLPHNQEGTETNNIIVYVWQQQKLIFLPSNMDNDIKLDYIGTLFTDVEDEGSEINVINARSYLEYRTAALVAEFVEHNTERANGLNVNAGPALDRALGINVKGKQMIMTRRRPFRSGYKRNK